MPDERVDVEMRSRYTGNLTEELRKDQRRIEAFQKILDRRPIVVPIKLDMQGALAQAKLVQQEIQKAISHGSPMILGPSGQPARSSLLAAATTTGNLGTTVRRSGTATFTTTQDQIAPGVTRTATYRGQNKEPSVITEKDVRNVREFQQALREVSKLGAEYGRAGARGDIAAQQRVIREQIARISGQGGILARAAQGGLAGSPVFDRAENRLDRLQSTLARLEGREESLADRASRERGSRRFERFEKRFSRSIDSKLDTNDVAFTAAKSLRDPLEREKEMNRVLNERRGILEKQKQVYQRLDPHFQSVGRPDLSDKAFRRTLNADNALGQHDKDAAKLGIRERAAAENAAEKKATAEQKQLLRERREARKVELERMLQEEVAATRKRIARINAEERQMKAKSRRQYLREGGTSYFSGLRQREFQGSAARILGIQTASEREGFSQVGLKARTAGAGAEKASIDQMERHASATTRGGHALNFHSSALLRNAATFARWYAPMQAVLGIINSFNAGISGMVGTDRQFATLQAVFRGTREEAQLLKEETLQLAVANGRSADEAMDAAIRFSRLGLTRVQALKAVETALMAANVAEVDAAYAAEKLSAIYATYKLTVDDLPVVLNRLNAISNRYNVTNKDLLEGITRVASVARNAGLELRDLEGIIAAAAGATGRPGQEIGTALRYVITKTARPETAEKLKEAFDFDITRPTGEMKGYLEILQDLAALLPTLNNYEKARILDMTAGARQASKFSAILDNFNQAQALTIEAALDTNSAFEENQKIVASLSSQLQSLASEWTALWAAIGDTGAIDTVGQVIFSLTEQLGQFTDGLREARQTGDTPIEDRKTRALVATTLGDRQLFHTSEKFRTRDEIQEAINRIQAARERGPSSLTDSNAAKAEAIRTGQDIITENGIYAAKGGYGTIKLEAGETWDDVIAHLEKLITAAEDTSTSGLRERAAGIERLVNRLEALRDQVEGGHTTGTTNARDFEALARAGRGLTGGNDLFAEQYTNIRSALEEGDTAKAMEGIAAYIQLAKEDFPRATAAFEEARTAQLADLNEKLAAAQQKEAEIVKGFAGMDTETEGYDELNAKLRETQDEIKALQDSIQSVNQETGELGHQAIASFGRLEQWFGRMRDEMELLNDFRQKILAGDDAPIERRILVGRMGLTGALDALTGGRDEHVAKKAQAEAAKAYGMGDPDTLDHEIRQHDEIISRYDEEIKLEQKAVELAEKKLAANERLMRVQEAINTGRTLAGNLATSLGIGKDETAQGANVFQGILSQGSNLINQRGLDSLSQEEAMSTLGSLLEFEEQMRRIMDGMGGRQASIGAELGNLDIQSTTDIQDLRQRQTMDAALRKASLQTRLDSIRNSRGATPTDRTYNELQGHLSSLRGLESSPAPDDPVKAAMQTAEFTDRRQRSEELIFSLMEREAALLQERQAAEAGITEEQRKQAEEANRRLSMASREDQLRAAALKRTIEDSGPLGTNEFFYLSQNTRQTAANYLPNDLPQGIREPGNSQQKIAEVDAELASLKKILPGLRSTLESLTLEAPDRFNQQLADLTNGITERREAFLDELSRITGALPGFADQLETFSSRLTTLVGQGGPLATPANPLEKAPDLTQPIQATVQVKVDQVQIKIGVDKAFEDVMQTFVQTEFRQMEQRILDRMQNRAPDTRGANSASE